MTTPPNPNTDNTSEETTPRWLNIVGGLLLMLFSVIFTLMAVEVFMRVGLDVLPEGIQGEIGHVRRVPWDEETIIPAVPFQSSRTYQSHLSPGLTDYPVRWRDARFTFSTRSLWDHPVGLRVVDDPLWPIDIIAFGDSFTFCWTAVEDCWVQLLQSNYSWHVINAGTPGNGPGGQLTMIEQVGVPLEPSLVIWQRYDNDLMDDYVLDTFRGEVEGLELPPPIDPVREPRGMAQYSAIWHLIDNRLNPPPKSNDFKHGKTAEINGQTAYIATDEYLPANDVDAYEGVAYGYEKNIEHYQQGIDLVRERLNAPVVIVMIPYKELVYKSEISDALPAETLERMHVNHVALLDVCEERGWYCLDALPGLKAAAESSDELVYYAKDFHLAPYGNEVLAELIHDYLLENELLAPREE